MGGGIWSQAIYLKKLWYCVRCGGGSDIGYKTGVMAMVLVAVWWNEEVCNGVMMEVVETGGAGV